MISKHLKKIIAISLFIIIMLLMTTACTSFHAGVPDSFAGQWKCEETASDGKTDTGFYEMNITEDGHFSIYDAAAGNPGISGQMGNDTGSTIDCRFDMDDFDAPFCWTIESSEATLDYEVEDDTLKLGHNDVWMIFHRMDTYDTTSCIFGGENGYNCRLYGAASADDSSGDRQRQ